MTELIPIERIENKILIIREQKVLLDRDLAELYGVETRIFNQAIKRNLIRFPVDFMFQLKKKELMTLLSQNVIANKGRGGVRNLPYAFTEHGAIMVASVLRSQRAVEVSVSVVRAFVQMRLMLNQNEILSKKLIEIEERVDQHDKNTIVIMAALRKLINQPAKTKQRKIGFHKE